MEHMASAASEKRDGGSRGLDSFGAEVVGHDMQVNNTVAGALPGGQGGSQMLSYSIQTIGACIAGERDTVHACMLGCSSTHALEHVLHA